MSIAKLKRLLEYNRNITIKNFRDKMFLHWQSDSTAPDCGVKDSQKLSITNEADIPVIEGIIGEILSGFEGADPTSNKEYVQWLAREYGKGDLLYEDAVSIGADALAKFVRMKRANQLPLEIRDINRMSFSELVAELDAIEEVEQVEGVVNKGVAEKFYVDNDVQVIIPEDKAAAIYYGRGAVWCTAATKADNYFDRYKREGYKLYIILPKHPNFAQEKYQVCTNGESSDYLNNFSLGWVIRFPQLAKVFVDIPANLKKQVATVQKNVSVAEKLVDDVVKQGFKPEKETLLKAMTFRGFKNAVFSVIFNCDHIMEVLRPYVTELPSNIPNTLNGILKLDMFITEDLFLAEKFKTDMFALYDLLVKWGNNPGTRTTLYSRVCLSPNSACPASVRRDLLALILEDKRFAKEYRGVRDMMKEIWLNKVKVNFDA